MGDLYGKPVRIIVACFCLLVSIGLVGLQLKTGERIFSMLLGWDSVRTQIVIGSIVIVYSAFGG
jgi:Na+/proline symporter